MNWVIVIIGIIISIIMVFLANIILLFSIHPIVLILFVIIAIIGIFAYNDYENIFEFESMFGVGWVISFVGIIFVEIFRWDEWVAPVIIKAVPIYTETISEVVQSADGRHFIIAILLTIEEPIIIGLLFPLIFEGIHLFFVGINSFFEGAREKLFTLMYFNICLKFVQSSSTPVSEKELMSIIPMGNRKYSIRYDLLEKLKKHSCFDEKNKLYWNTKSYITMIMAIEDKLLHSSPRELEWLIHNVPNYENTKFFDFKISAINELIERGIFVLETTTGSSLSQDGEEKMLYRHFKGKKIKSVVIEDDPDFD